MNNGVSKAEARKIQESFKVTEDREERTKGVGGNEVSLMPGMGGGVGARREESRDEASGSRKERPSAVSNDAPEKVVHCPRRLESQLKKSKMLTGDLFRKAEQKIRRGFGGRTGVKNAFSKEARV